ncbi:MAG: histidine triad nucleotide-binding protein [Chloroflexota bacterium]
MSGCIFCKIVNGQIPSKIVHRDDLVTAFRDINAQAPTHILVVPNQHIRGADEISAEHGQVVAAMFMVATRLAESEGVGASGYRLVFNVGPNAGQSVFHLHLHLLGGRHLAWPPG